MAGLTASEPPIVSGAVLAVRFGPDAFRVATAEDAAGNGDRDLIHDRDPLFTKAFREVLGPPVREL